LHISKKDLVEAAVAFYLDVRREEMKAGMRQLLTGAFNPSFADAPTAAVRRTCDGRRSTLSKDVEHPD
jgi:hypothetical protein